MIYTIEKNGIQPNRQEGYTIKYLRKAIDKDGNEVEVVDENRREHLTVTQLNAQKASLQAQIKEIDTKLAEIAKL